MILPATDPLHPNDSDRRDERAPGRRKTIYIDRRLSRARTVGRWGAKVLALTAAGCTMASSISSGQPVYSYHLPLDLATEAAQEAVRACAANQYWVSAVVVDMDGVRQVVLRGDRSTVHTAESSFRKAFTVVTLGPEFGFDASSGFFQLMKTSPYAPQLATVQNVMALPGAVAIKVKGEMVGALGIGGAPGGDKDEVCAHVGVDKIQSRLPK